MHTCSVDSLQAVVHVVTMLLQSTDVCVCEIFTNKLTSKDSTQFACLYLQLF